MSPDGAVVRSSCRSCVATAPWSALRAGPASGGPGGTDLRRRAWWLARAYLNAVPTAWRSGGRRARRTAPGGSGLFVSCGGMRGGYARGGTTAGSVWLHGDLGGPRRRRHEARHADQWALLGPLLMPLLYGVEAALTRADPRRSRFERHAGLEDGGYLPRRSRD